MDTLIERSGFPEPLLAENSIEANRWRLQYINSLLSTDIFEVETLYNLKAMRLVFDLLRNRVGPPVSYQSISEDVGISPTTVKKYIQILEALYILFIVTPYSKNIAQSLLKEPKIHFFDTGLVQGIRDIQFENCVAVSLLKHVYAKVDIYAQNYSLHYLRTKNGQEVDFALVVDDTVELMIEAKLSDVSISKSLIAFHTRYQYTTVQLIHHLRNEYKKDTISILKADAFLSQLLA